MEASFENLFTIGGFYTHVSLSDHTPFGPILSSATVPIQYPTNFSKKNYTVLDIQYN